MLLTAQVSKAELKDLLDSLTPLRFRASLDGEDEATGGSLTLNRPQMEMVPGKGVRVRGDARIALGAFGITVPVKLQGWQVLLVPKVHTRASAHLLVLEPKIEELDLKLVPSFLNEKIAMAIGEWLAKNRSRLAWDFARTLSRRLPLSRKISPAETFEIRAVGGETEVTEEELRFIVRFEARIERGAEVGPATETERPHRTKRRRHEPEHARRTPSRPRVGPR